MDLTLREFAGRGDEPPGTGALEAQTVPPEVAADLLRALWKSSDGLLMIDRSWRIVYANAEARRIGRISDADIGRDHWKKYPDVLGTELETVYRRAMHSSEPQFTVFYYEPFGIWVDMQVLPLPGGIILHYHDITEVKQLQQERARSAARLQELFDTISDAVLMMDEQWRVTFLNRRAHEVLKDSAIQVGDLFWTRYADAVYEGSPFLENYTATMRERVVRSFVAFYPAPLNRWFRVESRPAEKGIALFFRDITQEMADEASLRDSEKRFRLITDKNPQALWLADPEGRITYANARFLSYLGDGFDPEQTEGWVAAIHPDDFGSTAQKYMEAIASARDLKTEVRLRRASDGAARWWEVQMTALRDEDGAAIGWLGVGVDIEDQRRAEVKLREEQERTEAQRAELHAVYQTAPVGLALIDPKEFRYLRVNDVQAELLGVPASEVCGRLFTDVIGNPDAALAMFAAVAKGETVRNFTYETPVLTRGGEVRTLNANYSPVYGPDGGVTAISAAVLDITHQKHAEAALVDSEKLAAVGRLAASISHEINNPLEAITNLLYLVSSDRSLSSEVREWVHLAQSEVARVSQIATQTLRFRRQANRPTEVTPAQLIDPVLNLYRGRLANSRIQVQASYSTARTMLCFENDLRQVLNNLIANAIDAMRPEGGRLVIRAHDAVDARTGRPGVRMSIADTGVGMSRETQQRLFQAFFTTKSMNGTGLGLWISQGIVERHGGTLRVRSAQNPKMHGSVFTLFLPLKAEEVQIAPTLGETSARV